MSGLTDADLAKINKGVDAVYVRESSMNEEVLKLDGQRYNNFRYPSYRFSGGVRVLDKRDPYDENDTMDIVWGD